MIYLPMFSVITDLFYLLSCNVWRQPNSCSVTYELYVESFAPQRNRIASAAPVP